MFEMAFEIGPVVGRRGLGHVKMIASTARFGLC